MKNPRTMEKIKDLLPFRGKVNKYKDFQYSIINIGIELGKETAISTVEQGMIAYWPLNDAVCIFVKEGKPYTAVSPVGTVTKNLHLLEKSKLSTVLTFEEA